MMREVCKRATRMGPTIPWDGCCPDGVEEEEDGELDSMIVLIKGKGNELWLRGLNWQRVVLWCTAKGCNCNV